MTIPSPKLHRAFTLVELLVVIAIIAVLAALAVVGALKAINAARSASNLGTLRELSTVLKSYSVEYGHYPPGYDPQYTEDGQGPDALEWQETRDTYPDIINAYMDRPSFNDFFLSPVLDSNVNNFTGHTQPTNFIGHPALFWQNDQRDSFGELGEPPFSTNRIQRPANVMLLADGVPTDGTKANGCEVCVKPWAQNGSVLIDNPDLGETPLNLDPPLDGKTPSRWIDFRNNGKAHVLFVDGHTEVLSPSDFKVNLVSLGY
ncbi:MAG: prepilin-type N-terminal cleavage/methylation domain-containing protein [Verrucomicrobia bacterium]|nr:prepilin-type N-terminal cleavage/methylation domain-containing protein [Verrucomicrobiota bacterium]MDA1007234.1 prepilin-type N-terminal cleavage/methylation domain-containing protein [Verrucomicrobiota bacterium]